MTLNITIVAPWGIWQCSDYRLSDPRTGQLIEDSSVKHIAFRFPDGGALLAYSGIGSVDNVHISDWVRKILRGQNRTLARTFLYLREEATKTIGPIVANRYHHMFSIGGFLQRRPWIVQIRNFEVKNRWEFGPPLGRFMTAGLEIKDKPMIFLGGAYNALTKPDIQKLVSISSRRPRRPEDFHDLLAKFNQKASRNPRLGPLISPSCVTSFMPPEAEPITKESRKYFTPMQRSGLSGA